VQLTDSLGWMQFAAFNSSCQRLPSSTIWVGCSLLRLAAAVSSCQATGQIAQSIAEVLCCSLLHPATDETSMRTMAEVRCASAQPANCNSWAPADSNQLAQVDSDAISPG
jgi:hypothetical protein